MAFTSEWRQSEGAPGLVLSVDGVTKRYGRITAVDDLSFAVQGHGVSSVGTARASRPP